MEGLVLSDGTLPCEHPRASKVLSTVRPNFR